MAAILHLLNSHFLEGEAVHVEVVMARSLDVVFVKNNSRQINN